MPRILRNLTLGVVFAILTLALDQWSKAVILRHFGGVPDFAPIHVTGFLDLVLVANHGVSFGMFNNNGSANVLVFSAFALVIVAVLLVWLPRARHAYVAGAIGAVIGGAVGNLIDRLRLGSVVDFIDFFVGSWHWYVFNVADAAICIGVGLLLLDGLLARPESPK